MIKNTKKLKVTLFCLIAMVLSVFGAVIAVSYIPRSISQEFYGIELLMTGVDEYEVLQTVTIHINGQTSYGMFAKYPRFDGFLEVSGYDFTTNNPNLAIRFINGFSMGGAMMYPVLYRGATRIESLGLLYTNEDFSSLVIHITEWTSLGGGSHQGQQGNRVIVAPAIDTNTALEVLRSNGIFWSEEQGAVLHQSSVIAP